MMFISQSGHPGNPKEAIPEGCSEILLPIAAQMVAGLETMVYGWLQVLGRQIVEKLMAAAPPPCRCRYGDHGSLLDQ